jgi:hypothetical protein
MHREVGLFIAFESHSMHRHRTLRSLFADGGQDGATVDVGGTRLGAIDVQDLH